MPPALPGLAPGRAAAIYAEMVLSGQSTLRAAALSPFSPHSAVRIHLQRRRGRYGAPGGGVGAFIPVLPSAGGPSARPWNPFQMPRLLRQTAALGLLVQGFLGRVLERGCFR